MIRPDRHPLTRLVMIFAAAGLGLAGCAEQPGNDVATTPDEVISPEASGGTAAADPAETLPTEADAVAVEPSTTPPADQAVSPEPAPIEPAPAEPDNADTSQPPQENDPAEEAAEAATTDDVLAPVTYEGLMERIAKSDAKITLVDGWASWCAPCKENFPHVIDMAEAYSDSGLGVIALSFDGGNEDEEFDNMQFTAAREFLAEQDLSKVESYRLDQIVMVEMFEKFDIRSIPAVFLYDAEGKQVARFTNETPDDQFTYDEIEAKVAELLGVEPQGVVEPTE